MLLVGVARARCRRGDWDDTGDRCRLRPWFDLELLGDGGAIRLVAVGIGQMRLQLKNRNRFSVVRHSSFSPSCLCVCVFAGFSFDFFFSFMYVFLSLLPTIFLLCCTLATRLIRSN